MTNRNIEVLLLDTWEIIRDYEREIITHHEAHNKLMAIMEDKDTPTGLVLIISSVFSFLREIENARKELNPVPKGR